MSIAERTKQYYSWVEVWRSRDAESSKALELAFYKINITARMDKINEEWVLLVPWVHEETAKVSASAFREGKFEYPSEIKINERWESYNRFKPAKFKGRGSKMILVIGLVLFLLMMIKTLYGLGIFG